MTDKNFTSDFERASKKNFLICDLISRKCKIDLRVTEHLPEFRDYDLNYGIDGFIFQNGEPKHGVALRVQPLDTSSFTIRYKRDTGTATEYEKRLQDIKNGNPYPKYTVQAYYTHLPQYYHKCIYVDPSTGCGIYRIGMVNTKDLYEMIESNLDHYMKTKSRTFHQKQNNEFMVVYFHEVIEQGYKLLLMDK